MISNLKKGKQLEHRLNLRWSRAVDLRSNQLLISLVFAQSDGFSFVSRTIQYVEDRRDRLNLRYRLSRRALELCDGTLGADSEATYRNTYLSRCIEACPTSPPPSRRTSPRFSHCVGDVFVSHRYKVSTRRACSLYSPSRVMESITQYNAHSKKPFASGTAGTSPKKWVWMYRKAYIIQQPYPLSSYSSSCTRLRASRALIACCLRLNMRSA
eukprot:1188931-Prorocentrum_minimum.AAC.2